MLSTKLQHFTGSHATPILLPSTRSMQHSAFGNPNSVQLLASVFNMEQLKTATFGGAPEVIFIGRANVGKSSLINALLGRTSMARTSSKPGHTQSLNFYGSRSRVDQVPKFVIVDAPGYGGRGRSEWGDLFANYLETRTYLRRVFLLINATHGVTDHDKAMMKQLDNLCLSSNIQRREQPLSFEAVMTKCDAFTQGSTNSLRNVNKDIWEAAPTCLPIKVLTSTRKPYQMGIDQLRNSITEACGLP